MNVCAMSYITYGCVILVTTSITTSYIVRGWKFLLHLTWKIRDIFSIIICSILSNVGVNVFDFWLLLLSLFFCTDAMSKLTSRKIFLNKTLINRKRFYFQCYGWYIPIMLSLLYVCAGLHLWILELLPKPPQQFLNETIFVLNTYNLYLYFWFLYR